MSVQFDQIPESIWATLYWFAFGGNATPPDTAAVRGAIGLGLLYGGAVHWALRGLPSQWSKVWITDGGVAALHWRHEHPPKARRHGRPRKDESSKERLVIGALVKHHGYQPGGSIENYEPAKTKELAKLASGERVQVSAASISRFLKRKFPNHKRGYDGYVAACNRSARLNIGMLLSLWQGEVAERLAELLPTESGREDGN
jgi:hypothetical protein